MEKVVNQTEKTCLNKDDRLLERRKRVLNKKGRINVFNSKIPEKSLRYFKDWGNTLISIRWRWVLLSLCVANGVTWLIFAWIYNGIATLNGDVEKAILDADVCIIGTRKFMGYFLLSMQTQTTIGGDITPGQCQAAWIVLTAQIIVGLVLDGAIVSAICVKLYRPLKHEAGLFSKKVIVCLRDDSLCLIFRVYDKDGRHSMNTEIRAFLLLGTRTVEGEQMENFMHKLKLQNCGLILWPVDIVHLIDENSPLWGYSAQQLLNARFEIVVTVCGESIKTGQPSENRISYLNTEILWGHRFKNCMDYDKTTKKFIVYEEKINATAVCETPSCSPCDFHQLKSRKSKQGFSFSNTR